MPLCHSFCVALLFWLALRSSGQATGAAPGQDALQESPLLENLQLDPSVSFIEVPLLICSRREEILKLDGWRTADQKTFVDVGKCTGLCLSLASGKKECTATKTNSVVIYSTGSPNLQKTVTVIVACGCVCCEHHICPTGFYWNAGQCRCLPKVEPRPCQRYPQYSNAFGTLINVGVCRGECDDAAEVCKAVVYNNEVSTFPLAGANVHAISKCGCSDCAVKPHWITAAPATNGTAVSVNVGMCSGTCGPEDWPTMVDTASYWTTACMRAESKSLYLSNGAVVQQVTKCDCKPVRPKCQRVPRYITLWNAGGVQLVDVGACQGQCGFFPSTSCVPTARETFTCHGTDQEMAACKSYSVIAECGCRLPIAVPIANRV